MCGYKPDIRYVFFIDVLDFLECDLVEGDSIAVVFFTYLVQLIVVLDEPVQDSKSVGIRLMVNIDTSPLD